VPYSRLWRIPALSGRVGSETEDVVMPGDRSIAPEQRSEYHETMVPADHPEGLTDDACFVDDDCWVHVCESAVVFCGAALASGDARS